ncbi:hypothetical protein [Thermosulfurimonas sp.]|uniref:hypothetical protein n=1 Tax=Thermosulfurimonas sp. TaxID=2080236 RepID=UPI0025D54B76|nr:hypothetical protein [Thermosulfurimonas sp.]
MKTSNIVKNNLVTLLVALFLGAFLFCPGSVRALTYTDLYPFLPDLPGFKAEPPSGSSMQTPAGTFTSAERTYRAGAQTLHVRIVTGSMAQMMWVPLAMQISYDTPEERLETITIQGFPAKRLTRKKEKGGTLLILLSQEKTRTPALMIVECEGLTPAEAQKYLSSFRLKDLASKVNP